MALDDVVRASRRYGAISEAVEIVRVDPYDPKALDCLGDYLKQVGYGDDAKRLLAIREHAGSPILLRKAIEDYQAVERQSVIRAVSGVEVVSLLGNLQDEQLGEFAFGVSEQGREMKRLGVAIAERNFEAAREIYAEVYDNKVWKRFIGKLTLGNIKFIEEYAPGFIREIKKRWKKENLSTSGVFDRSGVVKYVVSCLKDLGLVEKAEAFLQLGGFYSSLDADVDFGRKAVEARTPERLEDLTSEVGGEDPFFKMINAGWRVDRATNPTKLENGSPLASYKAVANYSALESDFLESMQVVGVPMLVEKLSDEYATNFARALVNVGRKKFKRSKKYRNPKKARRNIEKRFGEITDRGQLNRLLLNLGLLVVRSEVEKIPLAEGVEG